MEVVAALVIVSLMTALLALNLTGPTTKGEAAALVKNLDGLQQAMNQFRSDVGRFPSHLSYLSDTLPTTSYDVCNQVIPSAGRAEWRGPYLGRRVPSAGIPSGASLIVPQLRRDPATPPPSYATLFIDVDRVDRSVAEEMELRIDGDNNFAQGSSRWVESGTTRRGRFSLAIPVTGC